MEATETNDASEPTEASLLEMASAADNGQEVSSANEPEPRASGDDTTQADATPDSEEGHPLEKDTTKDPEKPAEQPQDDKPPKSEPSKYEKAKQREADAWKKINDEKAAIQREREAVAREREEARRQQERQPKSAERVVDSKGYNADDYEATADKFVEEGDLEHAKAALKIAHDLRVKEAQQQLQGKPDPAQAEKFHTDWRADMDATLKAHADFAAPNSEAAKAMQQLLQEEPIFGQIPGGFGKAAAIIQLRQQAGKAQGLEVELGKAKAEVARLTKLTTLTGGGPSAVTPARRFEELNESQMKAELLRMAEEADRS